MGQAVLEGCQMNCQNMKAQSKSRQKSQIYFSRLSSQLPEKEQIENNLRYSVSSLNKNNNFLLQISKVPSHYIEFVNYLFVEKIKFEDKIFVADHNAIIWDNKLNSQNDWARLSDMHQQIANLYRQMGNVNKSKVFQILQLLEKNIPSCLDHVRPLYLPKVGLAICHLYINGVLQEVVIDDMIPTNRLRNYSKNNYWYFLVEKSLAKILGNYAFIQQFSLSELFQEITGMPFQFSQHNADNWLGRDSSINQQVNEGKISSFKQIIESQNIFCLYSGGHNSQVYCIRCINGYSIKSIPLNIRNTTIFRVIIEKDQKASLRISYLNSKYESLQSGPSVVPCEIRLYKSENNVYTLIEKNMSSLGNNVYLGRSFLKFNKGDYILYIKRSNNSRKASLVCYSGEGISFKEINSKQTGKQILSKLGEIDPNSFQIIC